MLFGFGRQKHKSTDAIAVFDSAFARAKENFPYFFSRSSKTEAERLQKFEAIAVFMALYVWGLQETVLDDLRKEGLLKNVYQVMFDRFDIALREQGVGDLKIGPKVRALAAFFKQAVLDYGEAYAHNNTKGILTLLQGKELCEAGQAMQLSIRLCAEAQLIKTLSFDAFLAHVAHPTTGVYEPHVSSEGGDV